MKERINISDILIAFLRKDFKREHSKFVRESRLQLEHLGDTFPYGDDDFEVIGSHTITDIIVRSVTTGKYYSTDWHIIHAGFEKKEADKKAQEEQEEE